MTDNKIKVFDEYSKTFVDPSICAKAIKKYDFLNNRIIEFAYTSNKSTLTPVYSTSLTFVNFEAAISHPELAYKPSTNSVYIKGNSSEKIINFNSDLSYSNIQKPLSQTEKNYLTKNNLIEAYKREYKLGTINNSYLKTEGLKYTFGVELETSSGYIPRFIHANLNMKSVRDGSINGGEYPTGVLNGDSGLNHLKEITYHLSRACTIDHTCGMHVHIGGAEFNKVFTVAAYKIGLLLQDEIFDMFPKSRLETRNEYYRQRGRTTGCCAKLAKLQAFDDFRPNKSFNKGHNIKIIEGIYSEIFKWLSDGNLPSKETNKLNTHGAAYPNARYVWLNLIPCNFSKNRNNSDGRLIPSKKQELLNKLKKSYTIEFRNHSATLDYVKIEMWILICMAIVNYIENNSHSILLLRELTLSTILYSVYSEKLATKINNYVEDKKKLFNGLDFESSNELEDNLYNLELNELKNKFKQI